MIEREGKERWCDGGGGEGGGVAEGGRESLANKREGCGVMGEDGWIVED